MSANTCSRIDRLEIMASLLPLGGAISGRGISLIELEKRLMAYPGLRVPHRRSLQRDLAELIRDGIVGVLDDTGTIPLYFRCQDETVLDEETWLYLLQQFKYELENAVSAEQLAKLFDRLKLPETWQLDDTQLRILPDSLRLQPAKIDYKVFGEVLRAIKSGKALQVTYRDGEGICSEPVLHPQGLLQRGPRIYLFALKNEELSDRMYALDRMTRACVLSVSARKMEDFDLDKRIQNGRADFADGEIIQLKAYVRGYVEQLLYDCPMNESQTLVAQDQDGSLLTVNIPVSGQLLRWVLAGGDNIIVREPDKFRNVVLGQIFRLHQMYQ